MIEFHKIWMRSLIGIHKRLDTIEIELKQTVIDAGYKDVQGHLWGFGRIFGHEQPIFE